jgi:glucokinase
MTKKAPVMVIVQGAPASGKTTLSRRLAGDTGIILLSKDDFKEQLFERLPQSDRNFSTTQGKAAIAMLYAGVEQFLKDGHDVMIESAFHTEYARLDIQGVLTRTGARAVEVFCHCDEAVRRQRFRDRVADGSRHVGHLDHATTDKDFDKASVYVPIDLCQRITIDTTDGVESARYESLRQEIEGLR